MKIIITEDQLDSMKEDLRDLTKDVGLIKASKAVGGIYNYVKILYDGDIIQFYKENNYVPYKISDSEMKKLISLSLILYDGDIRQYYKENNYVPYKISDSGMIMYVDDVMVHYLNLKDSSKNEKLLGDFGYGPKGGIRYKFTAKVYGPVEGRDGQNFWKVVGTSGDSGFGYSFISQKNTLGKRARMQIFQQIIDKYDLNSYL